MNKKKLHLLILEDNPYDAELMITNLESDGFVVEWKRVESEKAFKKALAEKPDIILADYKLPSFDGMASIKLQQQIAPDIPLIIVSGTIGEDTAVDCLKAGATDYVLKDLLYRLAPVVKRSLKEAKELRELRQAEKLIKESEEKYRVLFETAKDAIFMTDETGKFIGVNQMACESLGYTKKELLKMSNKDIDADTRGYEAFLKVRDGQKETMTFEVNQRRKDGTLLPVEVTGSFFTSGDKKFSLAITRDLNERKQSEEALKASEEKYRTLIESLEEGISSVDENENFTFVNKAASKIFGYSVEELLKLGLKDLTTPEEYKKIFKQTSNRKTGKTGKYEVNIIKKDGSQLIISVTSSPLFNDNKKYKGAFGIFRDITELERAKNELQISEERFQQVSENAQEWIWEVNTHGLYTYSSPTVEILLGYKPEEIVGKKHFYDLFFTEEKEKLKKAAFEVFNKKHAFREFINHNKHKDGRTVFFSTSGSPIQDENGELLGYRGVDTDITESKQAENAIRESEEKYRSLTEHLNVGVYRNTVGAEGRFIEANPAIVEMFGYKKKNEFLKLKVSDLYKNPEERKKFNEKMISEGFVRNEEIQLQKRDGTPFFGSISAVAVKDEKGKVKYYDGIIEDITKRKLTEEALRESEKRYRGIFDSATDSFLIFDYEGNIVEGNPQACKMYGYSHDELIKLSGKDIVHPDYYFLFGKFKQDVKTLGEFHSESIDIRKDGTQFNIEVSGTKFNYKGKSHLLAVVRDITERKKMEFELILLSDAARMSIDSIVISDFEGKITNVNEATLKMYGTDDKADLIGKSSFDIIAPEDKEKAAAGMKETMEKGYIKDREYYIVIKDGGKIPIEMSVSIIKGKDGKPIGFVSVTRDITERKQAQEELQESEEKYRQLAETAKDVIMILDLKGNVKYINQEGINLSGYSKEEALKMNINDVLYEDKIPLSDNNFAKRITGEKNLFMYEIDFFNKKGNKIPVEIKSSLITEQDKPAGVLIIARDTTERKKIEKELQNRLNELEAYHKITMGREGRIIELKSDINKLLRKLGQEEKYKIVE